MKRIYNSIFLIFALSVSAWGQDDNSANLSGIEAVKKIIMALPEVKAKDHVYDSITNRMQHIVLHIASPDTATQLYKVEAGYQGNNRFQPHFYIYVDLPGNRIYVEDLDRGDRTTLEEWRRRRAVTTAGN
jgi:hypothetical protein